MNARHIAVVAAAFAGVVACTTQEIVTVEAKNDPETRDLPLGAECRADEQCVAGLACKLFMEENGTCVDRRVCTTPCSSEAMCRAFDPNGMCMLGCNGESVCIVTKIERKDHELGLGSHCEASSECEDGLKCLRGAGSAAICDDNRTCSISCTEDEDCAELDETAKCFEGCSGKKICMLTAKE